MAYTQTGTLDRSLTDAEEAEFRMWAQQHDPPNLAHWSIYHPVCREEWIRRGIAPADRQP